MRGRSKSHASDALRARVQERVRQRPSCGAALTKALEYLHDDPNASLTRTREVLEGLVEETFKEVMNEDPKSHILSEMLCNNQFTRRLPHRIRHRITFVSGLGNLGAHHGTNVTSQDAIRALECLCDALEWRGSSSVCADSVPDVHLSPETKRMPSAHVSSRRRALLWVAAIAAVAAGGTFGLASRRYMRPPPGLGPVLLSPANGRTCSDDRPCESLKWHAADSDSVTSHRVAITNESGDDVQSVFVDGFEDHYGPDYKALPLGRYTWRVCTDRDACSAPREFYVYPRLLDRIRRPETAGAKKVGKIGKVLFGVDETVDNDLTAVERGLGNRIAGELNADPEFVKRPWKTLAEETEFAEYDAVIAAVSITERRTNGWAFSVPYLVSEQRLVGVGRLPESEEEFVIGYQENTTSESVVSGAQWKKDYPRAKERRFADLDILFDALTAPNEKDRIGAVMCDNAIIEERKKRQQGADRWKTADRVFGIDSYGLAMPPKEKAFKDAVDKAVCKHRGWLAKEIRNRKIDAKGLDGVTDAYGCSPSRVP